ncbi:MAG TPA: flagellar basal body L-ring protein FlgH [Bryobacteraceae bacterium]|jgi:flagellar L-ring protein precursor FlgH
MNRIVCILLCAALSVAAKPKHQTGAQPPLDRYVTEAVARSAQTSATTPGAIWSPGSALADGARDLRASQVDDILTILVVEKASAVASGTTKTARASSTANSVSALAGITRPTGPWANLAGTSGATQLSGDGTTSRDLVLSTTLTARVANVLPNGSMLVESTKDISINSERQTITVRGVARPADIGPDNTLRSDRLAELEVRVNGKGVVGDAIRRPFFLYRLLLGLLPF